jgi:mRNA interferase RelE/StbE
LKKTISPKWNLHFSPLALKDLKKLDKATYTLILGHLYDKLEKEDNPRRFGKPLSGELKNLWRYRIHDYRVICEIKDHEFQVLAVRVAHRSKVYKNVYFLKTLA